MMRGEDFLQQLLVCMEGKADVADFSLFFLLLNKLVGAKLLPFRVHTAIGRVQKIEVYVIHLEVFQMFVEDAFHILLGFTQPKRELGRHIKRASVIFFQRLADEILRIPVMIDIGGVEIIQAVGHGVIHHFLRGGIVDFAFRCFRESHTAESQTGQIGIKTVKLAFIHNNFPTFTLYFEYFQINCIIKKTFCKEFRRNLWVLLTFLSNWFKIDMIIYQFRKKAQISHQIRVFFFWQTFAVMKKAFCP